MSGPRPYKKTNRTAKRIRRIFGQLPEPEQDAKIRIKYEGEYYTLKKLAKTQEQISNNKFIEIKNNAPNTKVVISRFLSQVTVRASQIDIEYL
jgi:hypothetical protein